MKRRIAAIVVALSLSPVLLLAQDTVFTVTVASADVHKGPTTVTPVIGQVSRDTVLPVLRNLGSWVKIPWPDPPDGIAYVHVTMGRLGTPADAPASNMSTRASSGPAPATAPNAPLDRTSAGERVVPRGQLYDTPTNHIFGVGGLIGLTHSFGATMRAWRNNHFGVQFGFTQTSMVSDVAAGHVTSMQFEPGVVYALFDRVSDYVWIRPYVGSVMSVRHQTLTLAAPVAVEPAADNSIGFRVFAGGELTFAMIPRFGLSADVGYRRVPPSFQGFETDPLSVSIAGHWYFK